MLIGFVSVVLTFALIVGLQALYYHVEEEEIQRKTSSDSFGPLAEERARQRGQLNTYGWVDREAGIVHIPIDQAIGMVAEADGTVTPRPDDRGPE